MRGAQGWASTVADLDGRVRWLMAEAVRAKREVVRGLRTLVGQGELDHALRAWIVERPYLLDPEWETFRKDMSVWPLMEAAARTAGLADGAGEGARIALAFRSGERVGLVECLRAGVCADWDHLSRCRRYVLLVRDALGAEPALGIRRIAGLIVADGLDEDATVRMEIAELKKSEIDVVTWPFLLERAECAWRG